ncbi:MAG: ATP-binding protein [Bacteroidota bacterium]
MHIPFIGREAEKAILTDARQSPEAEMVAVIGRRRVGKTFLIKTVYRQDLVFDITGIQNGELRQQLDIFRDRLMEASHSRLSIPRPQDWFEAFKLLKEYLKGLPTDKKHVVFFDELPWLATHKSKFLQAFGYFWNSWAWEQNLVIVICGSAASWMIQKVVNNTGGLYNRITKRIYLQAFTLAETEEYLIARGMRFSKYHIAQLYMAMGGIPHYLKEIKSGKSATQNINDICFSRNGLLRDEFLRLYPSLFPHADKHFQVIRALANKREGLARQELLRHTNLSDGGGLTTVLDELTHAGFITPYRAFRKKKAKLYRLTDEYSLFYLKFIENKSLEGEDIWRHQSQTQAYKSWSGYAFENICLKHIPQIKKALGISGIYSQSSSFYRQGTTKQQGVQIDLLIDRKDHVINLFEIKFYNKRYILTKADADKLRQKRDRFEAISKTTKQLSWIFISSFGLTQNAHSLDLIDQSLTLDDLFG